MVGLLSDMIDELVWPFQKAVKEFRRLLFFHRPKFLSGTSTEYLMGEATHLAESVSVRTQTKGLIIADSESKRRKDECVTANNERLLSTILRPWQDMVYLNKLKSACEGAQWPPWWN